MPNLKRNRGPLITCAYYRCDVTFRKWRNKKFHTDACRRDQWKSEHEEYYIMLRVERQERLKKERRQARNYVWVEAGHEDDAPERLQLVEAMAQASPDVIADIKELLKEGTDGLAP